MPYGLAKVDQRIIVTLGTFKIVATFLPHPQPLFPEIIGVFDKGEGSFKR
jgi:hypothetical protein